MLVLTLDFLQCNLPGMVVKIYNCVGSQIYKVKLTENAI